MEDREMEFIQIMELKSAIDIILAAKDNPGASKSDLIKYRPGNNKTKFVRIDDLIKMGILESNADPRRYNIVKIYLTPKGQEIAKHLEDAMQAYLKG